MHMLVISCTGAFAAGTGVHQIMEAQGNHFTFAEAAVA